MKRFLTILILIALTGTLVACSSNKVYLNMDDVALCTGESFALTPGNLPEGFTVADCAVTLDAALFSLNEGDVLAVDDAGTVTALQPGQQRIHCDLNYKGKNYIGWCTVEVVDKLIMDMDSLVLLQGEGHMLTATNDLGGRTNMKMRWESEAPLIVSIDESLNKGVEHNKQLIIAEAAGETNVTVSIGDTLQSVCRVTVLPDDNIESYRYFLERGEDELVWKKLSGYCVNSRNYHEWLKDYAPTALQNTYAYPVDMLVELYDGQEEKIESSIWNSLWQFGLMSADEFDQSLNRLRAAATVYSALYGDDPVSALTYSNAFDWQNAVSAAQYAALGSGQGRDAIVMWTAEESYKPYHEQRSTPVTQAIFEDGMAAVADCGLTALLPGSLLPEQLEDVEYVIELIISGIPDDTLYYYSDTKELADDVTAIKTRVTCLVWQVSDGEWTQVYDAGYYEGNMPEFDFYSAKLIVGHTPSEEQLWNLISDAAKHIPE